MRPIGDLYKQIALALVDAIDGEEWDEAWLCAEIGDGFGGFWGAYKDASAKDVSLSFSDGKALFATFKEIRVQLARPDEVPWKVAKFSLHPSGKFNIEFEYNDSDRWRVRG